MTTTLFCVVRFVRTNIIITSNKIETMIMVKAFAFDDVMMVIEITTKRQNQKISNDYSK